MRGSTTGGVTTDSGGPVIAGVFTMPGSVVRGDGSARGGSAEGGAGLGKGGGPGGSSAAPADPAIEVNVTATAKSPRIVRLCTSSPYRLLHALAY